MSNKIAKIDEELRKLYDQSYDQTVDTFSPQMGLPIMKLVYKSQNDEENIIKNNKIYRNFGGEDVEVGQFYHSETGKSYKNPEIVIIHYLKAKLPSFKDPSVLQHTELAGGYLLEDGAPFMFFFKSTSLSSWWDFTGELAKISSEEHIGAFAYKAVFKTKVVTTQNGFKVNTPYLELSGEKITDPEIFKMLMESKDKVQGGLEGFVKMKKGEIIGQQADHSKSDQSLPEAENQEVLEGEDVDPDDIPL